MTRMFVSTGASTLKHFDFPDCSNTVGNPLQHRSDKSPRKSKKDSLKAMVNATLMRAKSAADTIDSIDSSRERIFGVSVP